MSKTEVKITQIKIQLPGRELVVSLEEAQALYDQLRQFFNPPAVITFPHSDPAPYPLPVCPAPVYPWLIEGPSSPPWYHQVTCTGVGPERVLKVTHGRIS
jgi:hypothetical protein